MSSAKDVFEAIQTKWNASALYTSYGYLQRDMKSYNKAKPYALLVVESVSRTHRTCSNEYWNHVLRIVVRATRIEDAESAIDTIAAAVDAWQLTISGGTQVRLQRESEGYYHEDEQMAVGFVRFSITRSKGRLN